MAIITSSVSCCLIRFCCRSNSYRLVRLLPLSSGTASWPSSTQACCALCWYNVLPTHSASPLQFRHNILAIINCCHFAAVLTKCCPIPHVLSLSVPGQYSGHHQCHGGDGRGHGTNAAAARQVRAPLQPLGPRLSQRLDPLLCTADPRLQVSIGGLQCVSKSHAAHRIAATGLFCLHVPMLTQYLPSTLCVQAERRSGQQFPALPPRQRARLQPGDAAAAARAQRTRHGALLSLLSMPALLSLPWPLRLLRRRCWACCASVCQPRCWTEVHIISFAPFSAVFAAFGAAMTPALPASLQLTSLQSSSAPAYAGPPVPDSDFATSL